MPSCRQPWPMNTMRAPVRMSFDFSKSVFFTCFSLDPDVSVCVSVCMCGEHLNLVNQGVRLHRCDSNWAHDKKSLSIYVFYSGRGHSKPIHFKLLQSPCNPIVCQRYRCTNKGFFGVNRVCVWVCAYLQLTGCEFPISKPNTVDGKQLTPHRHSDAYEYTFKVVKWKNENLPFHFVHALAPMGDG